MASMTANGNIVMSRFVKLDTTTDFQVAQCTTGDKVYGISQECSRNLPLTGWDDTLAAIAGEQLLVYTEQDPGSRRCFIENGSTITVGDLCKPDSVGRAVPTTTTTDPIGCLALASTTTVGALIPCQVLTRRVAAG